MSGDNTIQDRTTNAMHHMWPGKPCIADQVEERIGFITDNSKTVLVRRYLSKDTKGNIQEDSDGMFRRVARNLSEAEFNYHNVHPATKAVQVENLFYDAMSRLELLPNSPTLMNAGRELQQLSACFVLPVGDSIEGIFEAAKRTAIIHKSGGGTGFDFSHLRPEGDIVGSTGGIASGPVSFIRVFDTATDVVKQGGTRRGANMGILRVDHPDILKFIRSKSGNKALENFNISVAATDYFMQCVKDDGEYGLINPHTGELTDQINARAVFDEIAKLAHETGDPGLVFIDRINEDNPNPQLGAIESTNPCGEQPLLPYESCNLASINLARMITYQEGNAAVNWQRLTNTVTTGVHMLDNVIDMNHYPLPEIDEMSRKTRRIGLGVMGWADMLIQLGIRYDSDEAINLLDRVMKSIKASAYRASKALAEERGNYPAWTESIYNQSANRVRMRNSAPTTIAPTGTISIIAGASSGIEPIFAVAYERNVMDDTHMVEVNTYFEAIAKSEGFWSQQLMDKVVKQGSIQSIEEIPQWVRDLFPHRPRHQPSVAHQGASSGSSSYRQRGLEDNQPARGRYCRRYSHGLQCGLQSRLQGHHRLPRRHQSQPSP